jgi:hypothetical protein
MWKEHGIFQTEQTHSRADDLFGGIVLGDGETLYMVGFFLAHTFNMATLYQNCQK